MDGESFCCCQKPDKISQIRRAPSSRITHFINGLDSIDLHLHLPSYLSRSMILHYFSPVFQSLTIYICNIYTNDHPVPSLCSTSPLKALMERRNRLRRSSAWGGRFLQIGRRVVSLRINVFLVQERKKTISRIKKLTYLKAIEKCSRFFHQYR